MYCEVASSSFDIEITSGVTYGQITWDYMPSNETVTVSDSISILSHTVYNGRWR